MQLEDIIMFAEDMYGIQEQFPWEQYPGVSVLQHPQTHTWLAILMRQWSEELGEIIEFCDIKCGIPFKRMLTSAHPDFASDPRRVTGADWVGIDIGRVDDDCSEDIYDCFDEAFAKAELANVLVIDQPYSSAHHDIVVSPDDQSEIAPSFAAKSPHDKTDDFPIIFAENGSRDMPLPQDRVMQMLAMGRGISSLASAGKQRTLFIRQAQFMRDYTERTGTWSTKLFRLFPTYQSLTRNQLHGYFTWRTLYREDKYRPTSSTFISIYLNELFNGIGAQTPEDALRQAYATLEHYEQQDADEITDYLNTRTMHTWITDFCVVHNIDQSIATQYVEPSIAYFDNAIMTLLNPQEHTPEQLLHAIIYFDDRFADSLILRKRYADAVQTIAQVWTYCAHRAWNSRLKQTLCEAIFDRPESRQYFPLADALVAPVTPKKPVTYVLNPVRKYEFKRRNWYLKAYSPFEINDDTLHSFLREVDRILRRQWKTGGYLRERKQDAWITPLVQEAFDEIARQAALAQIPKIDTSADTLAKIRSSAAATQEQLLTDEERDLETDATPNANHMHKTQTMTVPTGEPVKAPEQHVPVEMASAQSAQSAPAPVTASAPHESQDLTYTVLQLLLDDQTGTQALNFLQQRQLLPSVVADTINNQCWDEFADTIVEYDGATMQLVEDYVDDIAAWLAARNE